MGCWNETCMVTHLPIVLGEHCAVVVLIENEKFFSACYPTHTFTPAYILHGNYDEYGSLEDIENEPEFVQLINKLNLFTKKDETYNSTEITSFESFMGAYNNELYACQVSGWTRRKAYLRVRIVFIKDCVLEMSDSYWNNPEDEYDAESLSFIKERLDKALSLGNSTNSGSDDFQEYMNRSNAIRECLDMMSTSVPNIAQRMFLQECYGENPELTVNMFRDILFLNRTLDVLRMSWHVPSGAGSQNFIDKLNIMFIETYQNEVYRLQNDEE